MLIVPLLGVTFAPAPPCDVCRLGSACACCWVTSAGAFLCCSLCAQNMAAGQLVRIGFRQALGLGPELGGGPA